MSNLITTRQAATLARVSVSTIDHWRRRGLVTPVRRADNVRGKPLLYRPADILAVESRTRRGDPARRRARRLAREVASGGGWPQSGIPPPV